MDEAAVIGLTRRWILSVVIGLNFCPFARRVFQDGKIRYAVSTVEDAVALLGVLEDELKHLAATPASAVETTLLIHPRALLNFSAYNDFLGDGDCLVETLRLRGVIQIASFHPEYQFAGSEPGALENYTNRSPYPMLHLLREASLTAVAGEPDLLREIPSRNRKTLVALGRKKFLEMLRVIE